LGASFVRTSVLEHGRYGLRHRVLSLLLLGGAFAGLAWTLRDALPLLEAGWTSGVTGFLNAVADAAAAPLATLLLAPFRALVRPLTAHSPGEWLRSMGPALLLLLLHYVWVVRADTAFEEAAAEASMERARRAAARRGGAGVTPQLVHRRQPRLLRLRASGWPATAILWKNLLAVVRTRRTRNAAIFFTVAAVGATALSFQGDGTLAGVAGWLAAMWAALTLVIGPQWVRNDLRGDLLKLDLLRSYPLRGRAVVTAEAAASALVLTLMQLALLALAYLAFLGNTQSELSLGLRTAVLGAAAVSLPALNFVGMLLQNGAALLFPAWAHLGGNRPGGVEALGQNMLMIMAYVAALGAALLAPGALAAGLYVLLQPAAGWWAAAPAAVALLAGLAGESVLMAGWLGRVFERTDPAAAGIAA
jgi:hypothetical protein